MENTETATGELAELYEPELSPEPLPLSLRIAERVTCSVSLTELFLQQNQILYTGLSVDRIA